MKLCEKCKNKHGGNYGSGRFCSKSCSKSRSRSKELKIVKCMDCSIELEVSIYASNKMCKCNNCGTRKNPEYYRTRNNSKKRILKEFFCKECNKKVDHNRKFCSKDCHTKYKDNLFEQQLNNNEYKSFNTLRLRQFLKRKTGHKCSICKNETWNNKPIPLILDHINGRALDNRLVNLRLVCGNCDMQLDTYKSKNKNSDRKYRK